MGADARRLSLRRSYAALRPASVPAGALVVLACAAAGVEAQAVPDSLPADTTALAVPADSAAVVNLPGLADPVALRPERAGVWVWERDGIYFAPGLTLADLLRTVPGLRVVQGGDYGAPMVAAAFGATAGRVRVIQDGVELVPLQGGVVDLSLVGLAGLDRVRVERAPGGVEIRLDSRRFDDPRPYSQIEAGTGDLETNFFRGTFALPRAPGGSLVATLDRVDTRGRGGEDRGVASGAFLRYTIAPRERFGAEVSLLKRSAQRSVYAPSDVDRTDWIGRLRFAPTEDLTLGVFGTSSSVAASDSFSVPGVRQVGLEAGWSREGVRVDGSVRRIDGDGLPSWTMDARATLASTTFGGVGAGLRRESWEGVSALRTQVSAWSAPLYGVSVFAELDRGGVGVPWRGVVSPADSLFAGFPSTPRAIDERATRRLGASFAAAGVTLRGARLSLDVDSISPYGLAFDATEGRVAGGERQGWEAEATLPLLIFDGLSARGSAVLWDDEAPWPYLPRLQYDASVLFHDTFLPTGNLEVLIETGVREREAMDVFVADSSTAGAAPTLAQVPFHQSWFARLHIRIVSVQLFVTWENLTIRRNNQDFPDRLLPLTRAAYGVRWALWN